MMRALQVFAKTAFSVLLLLQLPAVVYAQEKTSFQVMPQLGHADKIMAAAFSPDGRQLLTASGDYTLRLWDAATGKLLRILQGHRLWINRLDH